MRVVDLARKSTQRRTTVLSYGAMRSGKTRWAATWPRPLFLSDNTETGWTTVSNMDLNALYEPGRLPIVWAIEKAPDMMQALKDAQPLVQQGKVHTIVIDSITFYSDLYFNFIETAMRSSGRQVDNRVLYGNLATHLRQLRIEAHNLNVNVIWLALEKAPEADSPMGGPMLSGQNAQKFAAGCDYVMYHRSFQAQKGGPLQWEVRTRRYEQYQAGGRDEGLLPDPLGYVEDREIDGQVQEVFVPDCTYRTFAAALGIDTMTAPNVATIVNKQPTAQVAVKPQPGKPLATR